MSGCHLSLAPSPHIKWHLTRNQFRTAQAGRLQEGSGGWTIHGAAGGRLRVLVGWWLSQYTLGFAFGR